MIDLSEDWHFNDMCDVSFTQHITYSPVGTGPVRDTKYSNILCWQIWQHIATSSVTLQLHNNHCQFTSFWEKSINIQCIHTHSHTCTVIAHTHTHTQICMYANDKTASHLIKLGHKIQQTCTVLAYPPVCYFAILVLHIYLQTT